MVGQVGSEHCGAGVNRREGCAKRERTEQGQRMSAQAARKATHVLAQGIPVGSKERSGRAGGAVQLHIRGEDCAWSAECRRADWKVRWRITRVHHGYGLWCPELAPAPMPSTSVR